MECDASLPEVPSPPPPTFPYVYELAAGGSLTIHQDPPGLWRAGIGATVWDCGLTLSKFIERAAPFFRGKRIVEVGSGTGLVGLVAAAVGAHVLFTDQACALPFLRHNIEENLPALRAAAAAAAQPAPRLRLQPLAWGPSVITDPFFVAPDVILVSDCVVWANLLEPLLTTIRDVGRQSAVFLAYEQRTPGVTAAFMAAMRAHPSFRKVPVEQQHPDFLCPEIDLFQWTTE